MHEARRQREGRGREEWRRLVEEQEPNGHSQRGFCEAHGISVGTLQHWKRKLAGGHCERAVRGTVARRGPRRLFAPAAMLISESQVRIWLYGGPTDVRKPFDGPAG